MAPAFCEGPPAACQIYAELWMEELRAGGGSPLAFEWTHPIHPYDAILRHSFGSVLLPKTVGKQL